MPGTAWENLIGTVVDERYRLRALNYCGRDQAEFMADPLSPEALGQPVTLTLIAPAQEGMEELESQIQAARALDHPNLLRIAGAGQWSSERDALLYLAAETPECSLEDRLKDGPLSESEAAELVRGLVAGLRYLHGRGLVYRSLAPHTTVRAGGRWKLADFGRLAPADEASPAEDVRALGALLRDALGGRMKSPLGEAATLDDIERLLATPARRPSRRVSWVVGAGLVAVAAAAAPWWWRSESPAPAPVPPKPVAVKPAPLPRPVLPPPSAPKLEARKPAPAAAFETGTADFASPDMDGRLTASGERFDSNALTAAHRGLRLGARVRVTNLGNGRSVVVRVNDRLFTSGRVVRLTRRGATDLGFVQRGTAHVKLDLVQ